MCVHRRCVVWLWAAECACSDGVLCGCGQFNVREQTVFCVAVCSRMCVHRRCVVWLWSVECECTDGVLCGCGHLNVRAQTVCCVAVGNLETICF